MWTVREDSPVLIWYDLRSFLVLDLRSHQYTDTPGHGYVYDASELSPSSFLPLNNKNVTCISPCLLQVMQVVREQITRALPSKPNSLDQFKSKLRSLSYSEILRLRQSERMSQDDFQSPPIVQVPNKNSCLCLVLSLVPAYSSMFDCQGAERENSA